MVQDRRGISAWMDRAARGESAAFARVAGALQDSLYRFALAQGLAAEDAAEAVQETLLRAYRKRGRWRSGSDAGAWLFGFAINVIREFRRRSRRVPPGGLDLALLADTGAVDPAVEPGRREALRELARALSDLPDRQREAVTCRYLRQMSVSQTAEAMGCAEGTVKATVSSAMAKLKAVLQPIDGQGA